MRYLGNKDSLIKEIYDLLNKHNLLKKDKNYVFFDAFVGTGSVSDAFKDTFNLVINDNLKFCSIFATGRILSKNINFKNLDFDPIEYLNNNNYVVSGFISRNFAPQLSGRMYFTDFNAGRIDYFKYTIDKWFSEKIINKDQYSFLIASLIESMSKVANIAGVYGSYLKKRDPRAVKKIKFLSVESQNSKSKKITVFSNNLRDIISSVNCDILYLDPPYTKNKYTTQYHLIESFITNNETNLHGVTGLQKFPYANNDWSNKYSAGIELDNSLFNTKAKYILMSYSSDGLMSKEFILNVFRRYCIENSIECLEINYKKYRNSKTLNKAEHFEYLFFGIKKAQNEIVYCCPLNYMGGKSKIVSQIKTYFNRKEKFIDLLAGGFNVGINSNGYKKYFYNDYNFIVKEIVKTFRDADTSKFLKFIDNEIIKNNLAKNNKDAYLEYRKKYNNIYRFNESKWTWYLFVLILYGFQQQLRFNSKYEFNNTVGESGYNDSIKEKIISFSRTIKEIDVSFYSEDFEQMEEFIDENTVLYVDPPYLITLGSYNDGKRGFKGWNENEEKRLLKFLSKILTKKPQIVISNILEYNNKENKLLKEWIKANHASIHNIRFRNRNEVLIIL